MTEIIKNHSEREIATICPMHFLLDTVQTTLWTQRVNPWFFPHCRHQSWTFASVQFSSRLTIYFSLFSPSVPLLLPPSSSPSFPILAKDRSISLTLLTATKIMIMKCHEIWKFGLISFVGKRERGDGGGTEELEDWRRRNKGAEQWFSAYSKANSKNYSQRSTISAPTLSHRFDGFCALVNRNDAFERENNF